MAKLESVVDQISQSVAESVSSRIGLTLSTMEGSLEALLDIRNLLGKMIDPTKTVQQDQKFPFVFTKTFEKVLINLKDTSTNFKTFSKDPNKRDSNVFFDAVSKIPSKIEEKISNKVKDVAYSFVPEAIKSKVLSFTGVEQEKKPKKELVKDSSADIKVADQKQTEAVKPTEVTVDSAIPSLISKGFESVIEAIDNKSIEIEPIEAKPDVKAVEAKPVEAKPIEVKPTKTNDPKSSESLLNKLVPNIISGTFKSVKAPKEQKVQETPASALEQKDEPKPILFAGFTDKGYAELKDKLPSIISGTLSNAKPDKKSKETGKEGGFLSSLLGGAGLILGGLTALVGAFMTDGPMKGSLEMIGKVGLKGGLAMLAKKLFGATLKTALRKIPIIGTIISYGFALQRFSNGDTVGGLLDLTSGTLSLLDLVAPGLGTALSLGVDVIQSILDVKTGGSSATASAKKGNILKGWVADLGKLVAENIVKLPIIGPAVKAVEYFAAREWKKGLKQLALMNPIVDGIAALLGDEDASDTAKAGAGLVQGINWSEIGTWMSQKLVNIPIIGPALKACQHFADGDYLKGLKQLAYIVPVFEMLGGLLGDTEAGSVSTAIGEWGVDLVTDLSKWIIDSLSEMINIGALKDKILGAASGAWESRPTWMGGKGTPEPNAPAAPATPAPTNTTQPSQTTPAQNNTEGLPELAKGGIVTKPTKALIGEAGPEAIVPLEKLSSIAPVKEARSLKNEAKENNASVSFSKAESILEKIANNTSATNGNMSGLIKGFNDLAQALKQSGTIKQAPIVVQQNSAQTSPDKPNSSRYANLGNSEISSFRLNTVENYRFAAA